ncbi:hypothetical protein HG66A1_02310 [Gimesia chilikensis]|uniref:Uncharacterized protein n=1 Tax=Gimesia chilikensis TaxID=2605989 RepID=A0A517PGF6_9PLAN|nr:hypothetical protein HG66A1_02310 [Gimesia chilikensis]
MLLSYGRYRNRYISGFSILFICVAALFWGEHSAQEPVKAAAEQSEEEETGFLALPSEFKQPQIETILMSKIESPPRRIVSGSKLMKSWPISCGLICGPRVSVKMKSLKCFRLGRSPNLRLPATTRLLFSMIEKK